MLSQYFFGSDSALVYPRECWLTGVAIESPSSSDYITLYDGQDNVTGNAVLQIASPTNTSFLHSFATPIQLTRGLYVLVSGTPTNWSIFYSLSSEPDPLVINKIMVEERSPYRA